MMKPHKLPFADQIVFGSKIMPKSGYLNYQQIKNQDISQDIDVNFYLNQVDTMSLDVSQLKAIQTILKNGISLIQGPPGTGKTYCGALGVKILLQNQLTNNSSYSKFYYPYRFMVQNKPILIVCQTNHALFQFLKHILTFCQMEDIVRIGGRCKVEEFKPMLLSSYYNQFRIDWKEEGCNWKEFLEQKLDLDEQLSQLLNFINQINPTDFQQYEPDLFEKIICQYLEIEDLNFQNPISIYSKKIIMNMWLDNVKPQKEQVQTIINIENQLSNCLIKKQTNKKTFKSIMVYKFSDLDGQFNLSDEVLKEIEQEDEDDFSNENLDSDEEENRKILINQDNDEKDEFIKQPINDMITIKRLLNRLNKDDKANFYDIMNEINEENDYQIWEMPQGKRNVISNFIFSQKLDNSLDSLEWDVKSYESLINEIKQVQIIRDIHIIQNMKIVGVTLTGFAKYAEIFKRIDFNTLVVEEAGEVLESNLIAVLSKQINHQILIGDHQQLNHIWNVMIWKSNLELLKD